MEEPQPHDSQNQIIEPSDYRTLGSSIPTGQLSLILRSVLYLLGTCQGINV